MDEKFFAAAGGRKWWKHTRLAKWVMTKYIYSQSDWGLLGRVVRKLFMYEWNDALTELFGEPPMRHRG